jgi:hypothetical protein
MGQYFHRHSQGDKVKSFVLMGKRSQTGKLAIGRSDAKGHLNSEDGNVVLKFYGAELGQPGRDLSGNYGHRDDSFGERSR